MAASLLLLIGSTGWSALRFIEAVGLKQQSLDAAQKSAFYQERFALARRGLPPTAVDAAAIETAVGATEALTAAKASPVPALRRLGGVLAEAPTVTVDKLTWFRTFDPNRDPQVPQEAAGPALLEGSPDHLYYAVTDLEAHLADFDGDYRAAIALIEGSRRACGLPRTSTRSRSRAIRSTCDRGECRGDRQRHADRGAGCLHTAHRAGVPRARQES